jgi:hypothetical protein
MKQRGIEVEVGKTRSPPLAHPYIVIGTLGDNWGWFSSKVQGRTVDWGGVDMLMEHEGGCVREQLKPWLDNPMVRAVVVQQHQDIFHDKVVSLPLGFKTESTAGLFQTLIEWKTKERKYPKKVRLLLINNSCYQHRRNITRTVESLISTKLGHFNSYGLLNPSQFAQAVASSKFVFCPSGLGWDCYRVWEVLFLGSIPVIERSPGHKTGHGWDRTLDDLPVLWVDNFSELTVELLENSYAKLIAKAAAYKYEKLTQKYWEDLLHKIAQPGVTHKSGQISEDS